MTMILHLYLIMNIIIQNNIFVVGQKGGLLIILLSILKIVMINHNMQVQLFFIFFQFFNIYLKFKNYLFFLFFTFFPTGFFFSFLVDICLNIVLFCLSLITLILSKSVRLALFSLNSVFFA